MRLFISHRVRRILLLIFVVICQWLSLPLVSPFLTVSISAGHLDSYHLCRSSYLCEWSSVPLIYWKLRARVTRFQLRRARTTWPFLLKKFQMEILDSSVLHLSEMQTTETNYGRLCWLRAAGWRHQYGNAFVNLGKEETEQYDSSYLEDSEVSSLF